ncbi:sigma-70 family RNA polymerase sigma factor [Cryobacterium sp. SO2]|uniref:RNA polymerase sigma factor n=1 Tax=Cryobacterium sp. SO2 TaxID=1897060 RepID=UPI00223E6AB0|nr:sigma-70 family RNA polymerase sigma factor [Cryobacterium sp. SO2]WEO75725.1 sigma-70 family RNA polymerase sigma factor [Cryobacterium sp. SO2]
MRPAASVPDAELPDAELPDADAPDADALPTSDLDLFALVRAGDRQAFRTLFRVHQRTVYWAAFSVLRSRPDSEEVLQDAFLTLWNKRAGIDLVGESAVPWLVTTARYLALNRRRAEVRRPRDSLDDTFDVADDRPSPETLAIGDEAMRNIHTIIATLPAVDQRIFELCLIDDLSYEQAAGRLGITHATVRNRLSRLKGRLRDELTLLKGEPNHGAR